MPDSLMAGCKAKQWRGLQGEDAHGPHQHEGEREPEHGAPEAVQRLRGRARELVPQRAPDGAGEDLPEHREGQDASERYARAVERVPALGHQGRGDPGPHGGADDHADQREGAGEKARPRTAQHGKEDEQGYDQIERGHQPDSTIGITLLSIRGHTRPPAGIIDGR